MNVYDFDKTIYEDDSTIDFYFYTLKRHLEVIKYWPSLLWSAILWGLRKKDKTAFKECFYKFLKEIGNIDLELELFWDCHQHKIKDTYLKNCRKDDVIISASPEFLLRPICKRLGVTALYASKVDKKSGKYDGLNCWGDEKVRRFYEAFGKDAEIDEFYSDSLSDTPLAKIAKKSFIVTGEDIIPWQEYKK